MIRCHLYTKGLISCVPQLGRDQRKLASIPGFPPVLEKIPREFSFAERCRKRAPACTEKEIALVAVGEGRFLRRLYPESNEKGLL